MPTTKKYRSTRVKLAEAISDQRHDIEEAQNRRWMDGHDSKWVANRLLDWFNRSNPGQGDIDLLLDLLKEGRFISWDCPACGSPCHEADPEEWGHFQGVSQLDRVSYPGNRHNQWCCDHCRMWQKNPACPDFCDHDEE